MLLDMLNQGGVQLGSKHVAMLMKRIGIEALFRKPKTTKKHPQHHIYQYPLRGRIRCSPRTDVPRVSRSSKQGSRAELVLA